MAGDNHETGPMVTPDTSPVPDAQNPNEVDLAPGAITAAQSGGVTVTASALRTAVPLHDDVIADPVGIVNLSRQVVLAPVPVFATVKLRQKPVAHVESRVNVAVSRGDPWTGTGVGVGAGVGVGVGVGAGVGVGVGVGAGAGVVPPGVPDAHVTTTLVSPGAPVAQSPVSE